MHAGGEPMFQDGAVVDKDRAKGTINEVVGHAKRQVGA
jgi:uncharacterized protein YjbJ (UPF0337 family)